jgi:hypothetical protein
VIASFREFSQKYFPGLHCPPADKFRQKFEAQLAKDDAARITARVTALSQALTAMVREEVE